MNSSLLLPKIPRAVMFPPSRAPAVLPAYRHDGGSYATAVFPLRVPHELPRVRLSDPAIRVLTDFTREPVFTVHETRKVEDALEDMFRLGVRALLVARESTAMGLITFQDIQTEPAPQVLLQPDLTDPTQLEVRHVMTRWEDLATLDWRALCDACVGEILETFRDTGASHLIVLEDVMGGGNLLRGLLSRTRLERQLGDEPH